MAPWNSSPLDHRAMQPKRPLRQALIHQALSVFNFLSPPLFHYFSNFSVDVKSIMPVRPSVRLFRLSSLSVRVHTREHVFRRDGNEINAMCLKWQQQQWRRQQLGTDGWMERGKDGWMDICVCLLHVSRPGKPDWSATREDDDCLGARYLYARTCSPALAYLALLHARVGLGAFISLSLSSVCSPSITHFNAYLKKSTHARFSRSIVVCIIFLCGKF